MRSPFCTVIAALVPDHITKAQASAMRVLVQCQGKAEMSYPLQNRNVRFCPAGKGARVIPTTPVKRRRAMLASNPIEDNRPELIVDYG
jgi:hypothetical protein